MRLRIQGWKIFGGVIAVAALAALGSYFLLTRGASTSANLVSFLPSANATVVYIDVAAIRRAGILGMIAGSKATEESDYRQFVEQTNFDYGRDLDAVAAAFKDGQVFLAVRGRFHWANLSDFVTHQGGSCHNNYCVTAASQPNRRVSFYKIKSDLMGVAVSPDDFAAYQVMAQSGKPALNGTGQPIWAFVPGSAFKDPAFLPAGVKAYVSALESAEQALFTIGPDSDHLKLSVNVTCRDAAAATALAANFQNITDTLRKWIAREHQQANPADLSGILVGGAFRRQDRQVEGSWPIPQAFVKAITSGAL